MSTSRIGGDFDYDALEAFRSAYADQLSTPSDQDIDYYTGLPTENITNVSPWIETTGLWRYPSGKGPDDDLKQPFSPEGYISEDDDDDLDDLTIEELESLLESLEGEDKEDDDMMSDEELDNLVAELLDSDG